MNDDFVSYIETDLEYHLVNGQVDVGSSATGVIETERDNDWFKVEFIGGHSYEINMEGSQTGKGTLSDPFIRGVYNSDGLLLDSTMNDDGGEGFNSFLTFAPQESGTYYISAGSYGNPAINTPYATGSYTVSVMDVTPDELVSFIAINETDDFINFVDDDVKDMFINGRVEVGSSATGVINYERDSDWFRVELKGGHTYTIDMEGSPTEKGTLSDPTIRGIRDEQGQYISSTTDEDGGEGYNAKVTFTPEYSGTYYIIASSYGYPYGPEENQIPYATGSYTLSVSDLTPEAPEIIAPELDSDSVSRSSSSSSSSSSSPSSSSTFPDLGNYIVDYLTDHPKFQELPDLVKDTIEGTDDNDIISGTAGDDLIISGNGTDIVHGGSGQDDIFGGSGMDTLNGDGDDDFLNGGAGENTLNGGPGHDEIYGGTGVDTISGGSGKDFIWGDYGNDTINGGPGRDLIYGNGGNDSITGGSGNDILQGGSGSDTFVFGSNDGRDIIGDFNARLDKIKFDVPGLTFEDLRIVHHAVTDSIGQTTSAGDVTITGAGTTIYLEGIYVETDLGVEDFIFI